jgi:hypothetical protein
VQDLLDELRRQVSVASTQPSFRHHQWYVRYHLEIVSRITDELLAGHPEADQDLVRALVWIHDYGKTFSFDDQYRLTLTEGRKLLDRIGFPVGFTARLLKCAAVLDSADQTDLSKSPVEVQIVSSADGCAHLVGPFFQLWWWEHPGRPVDQLMADNRRKLARDWQRKVVLPEARAAFAARHRMLCEQAGDLPARFLKGDVADD